VVGSSVVVVVVLVDVVVGLLVGPGLGLLLMSGISGLWLWNLESCDARGPDSMSGDSVQARKDQNLASFSDHCVSE